MLVAHRRHGSPLSTSEGECRVEFLPESMRIDACKLLRGSATSRSGGAVTATGGNSEPAAVAQLPVGRAGWRERGRLLRLLASATRCSTEGAEHEDGR